MSAEPATATGQEAGTEADFVKRFTEAWADPSPDRLNALLHPDGRLLQPIEPEIRGHAEAARAWRRLFYLLPDCRAEVLSWSGDDGLVFIQGRLGGTLAGRRVEWTFVDRIRLEDGLVTERIAYFDPLPVMGQILRRPQGLLRFLRSRRVR